MVPNLNATPRPMQRSNSSYDRPKPAWTTARSILWDLFQWGTEFFYPSHCAFCRAPLSEPENSDGDFCGTCRRGLCQHSGPACAKCGAPVGPHVDPAAGCNYCVRESFAFDRVIRLGLYSDTLRRACLRAKYARQEPLLAGLAKLAVQLRRSEFRDEPVDIVIPIPHYWLQRVIRPHNPAETLAGVLVNILNARKNSHILLKTRWTRPQRSLPAVERRKNVRRAFQVANAEDIKNQTVLLVDDIMTTGATAHEAARVLRRAGAKKIVVAVIARAVRAS